MSKTNSKKTAFLSKLPESLIDDNVDKFKDKLNFNFAFFDHSQRAGQDFKEWDKKQLVELLEKLKEYCKESVEHLKRNAILKVYGKFPIKTDFVEPKHIPLGVEWARFRLEGAVRLAGFIIDRKKCEELNLHSNTFYVVFLDENHKFWKTS